MNWIVRQKYLFDQGMSMVSQFVGLFNTSLLIIATSDKLKAATGIPQTWMLVLPAIIMYILGTWFLGCMLDRHKILDRYADEAYKRTHFLRGK